MSGCEIFMCPSSGDQVRSDVSSNGATTGEEEIASFRNLWRRKEEKRATAEENV